MSVAVVLVLAGCGSDDADDDAAVDLVVLGEDIFFDEPVYTAEPGTLVLEFRNVGAQPHNLVFEEDAGAPVAGSLDVYQAPGETVTYTLDVSTGSYVFYCSVPGHREAGMESVLDVG